MKNFPFSVTPVTREAAKFVVPERFKPLAAKITSNEQLAEAKVACRMADYCYGGDALNYCTDWSIPAYMIPQVCDATTAAANTFGRSGAYPGHIRRQTPVEVRWWAEREQLRQATGCYPSMSETLAHVVNSFQLHQYFIHMSPEDPSRVAYTPDAQYGAADRQVVTSVGKLLRKLVLVVTDSYIQAIEAAVRAEQDSTYYVATEGDAIEYVYTHMQGDSGCMRYSASHFGVPHHPSRVYEAPGMGVAFTLDSEGNVKSRSVIWTNPEDPGDKRYVRIYGDAALKRMLERDGYVCKALAGAKVRLLRHGANVIMPYLDGLGGAQSQQDGSFGAIEANDPDYIQLYSVHTAQQLARLIGRSLPQFKSTSPSYPNVPTVDSSERYATCPVTQTRIDLFARDGDVHRWLHDDGTLGWAKIRSLLDSYGGFREEERYAYQFRAMEHEGIVRVYGTRDAIKRASFVQHSTFYYNDEATRRYTNVVLLDPTHYPSEVPSVAEADDARVILPLAEVDFTDISATVERFEHSTRWVKTSDATRVCLFMGEYNYYYVNVHVSDAIELLKTKRFVKCVPYDGTRVIAMADHPRLAKMQPSQRNVIKGMHPVSEAWDGRVYSSSKVERSSFMGMMFNAPVGEVDKADSDALMQRWAEQVQKTTGATRLVLAHAGHQNVPDIVEHFLERVGSVFAAGHRGFRLYGQNNDYEYQTAALRDRLRESVRFLAGIAPFRHRPLWGADTPEGKKPLYFTVSSGRMSFTDINAFSEFIVEQGRDAAASYPNGIWQWAVKAQELIADIDAVIDEVHQHAPNNAFVLARKWCDLTGTPLTDVVPQDAIPAEGQVTPVSPVAEDAAAQAAEVVAQAEADDALLAALLDSTPAAE